MKPNEIDHERHAFTASRMGLVKSLEDADLCNNNPERYGNE